MKLEKNELININGGGFLTATYINAASRAVNTILDFGRTVGTVIRRAISKNWC